MEVNIPVEVNQTLYYETSYTRKVMSNTIKYMNGEV